MSRRALLVALLVSLALNFGVVVAFALHVWRSGELPAWPAAGSEFPGLAAYLKLDEAQHSRWKELESEFLPALSAGATQIQARREKLIEAIFAPQPDRASIEVERAAIAEGQARQQKLVISQLLREQELLDERQRALLAELLSRQAPAGSEIERLHRN